VDSYASTTDAQALKHSKVRTALQIGCNITKGLGAGRPEVGRQARWRTVIDHRVDRGLRHAVITAGWRRYGTGAAPWSRRLRGTGHSHVAVVTRPSNGRQQAFARRRSGHAELSKYVDSLITIRIKNCCRSWAAAHFARCFKAANTVLQGAVQGIAELIPGRVSSNVDFADVRT